MTTSTIVARVEELIRRAEALDQGGASERSRALATRLRSTVLRPLADLGDTLDRTTELESQTAGVQELLFELAIDLTRACATDQRAALLEACAGAHYLVTIGRDDAQERITRLAEIARDVPGDPKGGIRVRENGPYLLTGGALMSNFLGEPTTAPPVAALCRCGRSESKPWCDGTHATIGFNDRKHPDRVADRLDTYAARQFTILDNRGICAHSGRCTDALPTVFRVGTEPFVAPAGGRADDILRAIQACPSGALGAAIAERRAADVVDRIRPPAIEVSKDGPYYVTGGVDLRDDAGNEPVRSAGASREHFALCRCGQSKNKPFCSGAHWYADFHDPVIDPDHEPTLFEWAGGYPVLLRVTRLFYERHVPQDDLLAPLFSRMEPDHPERVAAWLSEVFGGPKFYSQRYGGYYPHDLSTPEQAPDGSAARPMGVAPVPKRGRSAARRGSGISGGVRRLSGVGYADRGGKLAGRLAPAGRDAGPTLVVGVRRHAVRAPSVATHRTRPPSRISRHPRRPLPGEALSFERHVKGLFRARDRGAMRFAFDLWSVARCEDPRPRDPDTPASRHYAMRRSLAGREGRDLRTVGQRGVRGLTATKWFPDLGRIRDASTAHDCRRARKVITCNAARRFRARPSFRCAKRCAKTPVIALRPRRHFVQDGTQAGTERRQAVLHLQMWLTHHRAGHESIAFQLAQLLNQYLVGHLRHRPLKIVEAPRSAAFQQPQNQRLPLPTDDVDRELHGARIRVLSTRRHPRLLAVRNAPGGALTSDQSRSLMVFR